MHTTLPQSLRVALVFPNTPAALRGIRDVGRCRIFHGENTQKHLPT